MIRSASILAINNDDYINQVDKKSSLFEMVHIDIADNEFCPTYGIPLDVLIEFSNNTNYLIDAHFMVNNPLQILKGIQDYRLHNLSVHCEAIESSEISKLKSDDYTLGIGILAETNLNKLKEYLPIVDSVLLLCVNPGYSHQNPSVSPVERVKELKTIYPNLNLNISVDGGVSNDMLPELLNLGVDIAVQGGAIFGSD
tara:strand:- start:269 stop:862 length:594 start_codon:yes stop_codon:yes gene_type:complete